MTAFQQLPSSLLQTGAIFLSIIIEALPFVLIGSIVSGLIEVYITPDKVYHFLPRNRWGRIFFGTFVGILFPSCECGIVPIINRFLEKKVPSYTAVPFLVTAPVINPIVLFATYSAFGNSFHVALLRALGSILVAVILGIFLARTDSKRKSFGLSWARFFSLEAYKKSFSSLCASHWWIFWYGALFGIWLSLRLCYTGLCSDSDSDLYQCDSSFCHPPLDAFGLSSFSL